MRFIAAIPNYNSGDSLELLVKDLLKEGFDTIYVLDDASTDDSLKNLSEDANRVMVIHGQTNLGPGGNRNRILKELRPSDVICFIDADMELVTGDFRTKVLNIFNQEETVGIIGGLILNRQSKPMTYNYGYYGRMFHDIMGFIFEKLSLVLRWRPILVALRFLSGPFTFNVAIIHFSPPPRAEPDWVSEGFCIIRGDLFREVNGFDQSLRYHEGQVLARNIYAAGYKTIFEPFGTVRHKEIKVRSSRLLRWRYMLWFGRAKKH